MIIDLLSNDGFRLKHVAATHGGEYASSCPWCGGRDRFRIWPTEDRYWCRQCGHSGDSIQYLKDFHNLSYHDACESLGKTPEVNSGYSKQMMKPEKKPKRMQSPNEAWQKIASFFIDWTKNQLWSSAGSETRKWLKDVRGISSATVNDYALGWNPQDFWRDRRQWGLDESIKENDVPKKLWLPAGLIIPYYFNEHIIRLRIRRQNSKNGPPYYVIPGSTMSPMVFMGLSSSILVVESELDGLLVHQESDDLVRVIAIGNAQARPDQETHKLLSGADIILVALDVDDAGAKETWKWSMNQYQQVRRWPPVGGKDPGEMFQAGVNIKEWIKTGLE